MNRKLILRAIALLSFGSIISVAAYTGFQLLRQQRPSVAAFAGSSDFAEPGSVSIGGSFTLVNHKGETVTDVDFSDRFLLVFFGFTFCPDVCPTVVADIGLALDALGPQASAVQALFVSVDPERDTPQVLAEYLRAFHPEIVGLTGTPAQIDRVVKVYKTFYEKVSADEYYSFPGPHEHEPRDDQQGPGDKQKLGDDYLVSHQTNTFLMSKEGKYLTHFPYGTAPEDIAKTVRRAIARFGAPKEARN